MSYLYSVVVNMEPSGQNVWRVHFATEDLDQGPIICQDIQRVPETASIDELVELGKDIEKRTLSAALKLWLEHRVFVYAGRTFIL